MAADPKSNLAVYFELSL